jgi:hypothetical protein
VWDRGPWIGPTPSSTVPVSLAVAVQVDQYPGQVPTERPHRPGLYADLTEMIDAAGGDTMPSRAEVAAATAAAVVEAGRADPAERDERFVDLADRVGIETLAALWSHSDPVSLPGALWALYLLRQWCRTSGDEVTRLWRAGEPFAEPHAAVAGVGEHATVQEVQRMTDAVLGGAYGGDFAVALERAAALFRVVAAGRRELGVDVELAGRNERAAADLTAAAARWRAGDLR